MRVEARLFLGAGVALAAGACAAAGPAAGPAATNAFPVVSCAEGVPVVASSLAAGAQRSLILGRNADALTGAQAAVAAESGNPQHHFLLAQTQVAASDFAGADASFDRTEQLCAGFAGEIAMERERAWATAFQQGLTAFESGDTATAIGRWSSANEIYAGRPDGYYNLGVVYSQRGELAQAAAAYREALAVLDRMPADTSATEMANRNETRQNSLAGLLGVGARLFQQEDFTGAAELFQSLTVSDANSRDAWYNSALALYKLERWNDLVPVARRVQSFDPLNENARIILFNAYKGQAEAMGSPAGDPMRNSALAVLEEIDALPVFLDEIRFEAPEGGQPTLTGKVTGNAATTGQQVALTFTFFGPSGQVGTRPVTVMAPAKGQSATFSVPLPEGVVTSYSYRVG
ncbi:MAG: tetratricopeptide repeat protein [Gemmatimonadota bacterium]|nr:tetratricopeptide repeat protein [Gemmatimonadota bacterium]